MSVTFDIIDGIQGYCPVQAYITVTSPDGERIGYFRARHGDWSLEIYPIGAAASPETLAAGFRLPDGEPEWEIRREYGPGPHDAGWMPEDHAAALIAWAVERYAAGDPGGEAGEAPPVAGLRSARQRRSE